MSSKMCCDLLLHQTAEYTDIEYGPSNWEEPSVFPSSSLRNVLLGPSRPPKAIVVWCVNGICGVIYYGISLYSQRKRPNNVLSQQKESSTNLLLAVTWYSTTAAAAATNDATPTLHPPTYIRLSVFNKKWSFYLSCEIEEARSMAKLKFIGFRAPNWIELRSMLITLQGDGYSFLPFPRQHRAHSKLLISVRLFTQTNYYSNWSITHTLRAVVRYTTGWLPYYTICRPPTSDEATQEFQNTLEL